MIIATGSEVTLAIEAQKMLAEKNIASLAIDLRGHGESSAGDPSDLDVQAALAWLAASGFPATHIALMGASIGANLALRALAQNQDIHAAVLLSPGSDYHGVTTLDAATRIDPSQALFIAASSGDDQQSFLDAQEIIRLAPSQEKNWKPFTQAGHAMHLLESHPELANESATWLAEHFS